MTIEIKCVCGHKWVRLITERYKKISCPKCHGGSVLRVRVK